MSAASEIKYSELNKSTFYTLSTSCFFTVRGLLYPSAVVRTRQQVSIQRIKLWPTLKQLYQEGGVRGLWRGFGTQAFCQIPSHWTYLTTLENTREFLATPRSFHNEFLDTSYSFLSANRYLLSGGAAAAASQIFFVPVDIVVQRMQTDDMLAKQYPHLAAASSPSASPSATSHPNPPAKRSLSSALPVIRSIWRADGWRGFYVGLLPSMLTNAPSSAIWWATFGVIAPVLEKYFPHSLPFINDDNNSYDSPSKNRTNQNKSIGVSTVSTESKEIFDLSISSSTSPSSTSTLLPSSSSMWLSIRHALGIPPLPSPWSVRDDVLLPMLCGSLSSMTAVLATNGIDVVKTRMQVLGKQAALQHALQQVAVVSAHHGSASIHNDLVVHEIRKMPPPLSASSVPPSSSSSTSAKSLMSSMTRPNMFQVGYSLWKVEGWSAFTRGMSARTLQNMPQSAMMTVLQLANITVLTLMHLFILNCEFLSFFSSSNSSS